MQLVTDTCLLFNSKTFSASQTMTSCTCTCSCRPDPALETRGWSCRVVPSLLFEVFPAHFCCVSVAAVTRARSTQPTSFTPVTGSAVTWRSTRTPACPNRTSTRLTSQTTHSLNFVQLLFGSCEHPLCPPGGTVTTCSTVLWAPPTLGRSSETFSPTSRLGGLEEEDSPNILSLHLEDLKTEASCLTLEYQHFIIAFVSICVTGWHVWGIVFLVGPWLNSLTCLRDTYCYSGIRRKTVLNMPLLPNLDLKNDPVHTLLHYYCFITPPIMIVDIFVSTLLHLMCSC